MDAASFPSAACFAGSSGSPPVGRSQNLDHPRFLSVAVNPERRRRTATARKNSSICLIKAAARANMGATGAPTSVPVRVAHELLLAGHRYLDVRTREEFTAGHASGAINIPYMYKMGSGMTKNPNFLKEVSAQFEKHDEIIIGCQLGKRSMMAATELTAAESNSFKDGLHQLPATSAIVHAGDVEKGFTAVTDIAGGYAAWTQNGLPTEG